MDTMSVNVATVPLRDAVADARDSARAFLEGLRQPAIAAEAADTVVLVVSELVTNALRHGGGTCTLELTAHPDTIEVAVHDPSPHAPRMRTPDLNGGTGGFGWPMVNRLARSHRGHPPGLRRQDRERASCLVAPPVRAAGWPVNIICLMSKPDELLVDVAALVESGQSNQMSLTVVTGGAVITGRLAPEAVWRQRVSEVLTDSDRLGEFSSIFDAPTTEGRAAHASALPRRPDPAGHGGDPGDGRDVPRRDRGRQRLDRGRLQLLRPLSTPCAREPVGTR